MMPSLNILPINLAVDRDIAIKFRADSFMCSFGHERDFWGEDGKGDERYWQWLKDKIASGEWGAFHVWLDKQIIGQIDLGLKAQSKDIGYVNLYYLAPEVRGKGYSASLDEFAMSFFREKGYMLAQLSVSPSNLRAISYYIKRGWQNMGPRFTEEELARRGGSQVNLMQKSVG